MRRTKTFRAARWVGQWVVFPVLMLVAIGFVIGVLSLVMGSVGHTLGWW